MTVSRRQFIQASAAAGGALSAFPLPAWSQSLESAKVVIGFAPGGTVDTAGRRVAEKLAPGYARTAIAENKTGAGGQIAVQAVKAAPPDGSTLLITPTSPVSLHLFTYRKLPYDPVADLTPVSGAASFDYALAVGPKVPADVRTVPEFLAWCKSNPADANFGSPGSGSAPHFLGAGLAKASQVDLRHIAFRGSQPAIVDMLGGQIAAVVGPTGEFMPNVQAGKLRLLGTSGTRRSRFTPEVATFVEQGFRDIGYTGWFGFYAPAKTPSDIVQRANAAIRAALAAPETVNSYATFFMEPMPAAPEQLAAMLRTETNFWSNLVKTVGFTPEG